MATFFPLQGFWNALIYFRPRYQESQKANRRSSFFSETGKNSAHYSNNWEQDKSGSHEGETGDLDMEYGGSDEMGGQQENLREEPPESVPWKVSWKLWENREKHLHAVYITITYFTRRAPPGKSKKRLEFSSSSSFVFDPYFLIVETAQEKRNSCDSPSFWTSNSNSNIVTADKNIFLVPQLESCHTWC